MGQALVNHVGGKERDANNRFETDVFYCVHTVTVRYSIYCYNQRVQHHDIISRFLNCFNKLYLVTVSVFFIYLPYPQNVYELMPVFLGLKDDSLSAVVA